MEMSLRSRFSLLKIKTLSFLLKCTYIKFSFLRKVYVNLYRAYIKLKDSVASPLWPAVCIRPVYRFTVQTMKYKKRKTTSIETSDPAGNLKALWQYSLLFSFNAESL